MTREGLGKEGRLRAVLVNSGNANACTGEAGEADAREMQEAFARASAFRRIRSRSRRPASSASGSR